MITLLYITAILLIATKFLDSYTTDLRLKNIVQERNRFARLLMSKIGVRATIYGIWVLSIMIVAITFEIVIRIDTVLYSVSFIALGLSISIIQFMVAHHNYTGKTNFVTKLLLKIYR